MTFVVVDVETTGLGHAAFPPRADGVVQVGMAWREKSKVNVWSAYCNPGKEFLADGRAYAALSINQIPMAVIRKSRPAQAVAQDFRLQVKAIEASTGEDVSFLAYNLSFDEGFLNKVPWLLPREKWGPCVMKAAAYHLTGYGRLGLGRAMQMLEIPWPGKRAHDAALDAHAALLVHEKINRKR